MLLAVVQGLRIVRRQWVGFVGSFRGTGGVGSFEEVGVI